eukprot:CAMPEP_0204595938 /NCGR_PEP_ID=MMETSP0661-20131031/52956_1 /ASSEMBLY_ACC=CAM_ASM_000606 /TAXON_ID=109239 /ORGANISM="Alexandrium margalefi, Strain AMGDE01CS-322" /LENGTH=87 /DNA_ID=CAMNT_0051606505 /DNA_START=319 /DNA_END=578 /DNA_ORIENTATION=-
MRVEAPELRTVRHGHIARHVTLEEAVHIGLMGHVHGRGALVQQHEPQALPQQDPCEAHALHLALREVAGPMHGALDALQAGVRVGQR